MYVMLEIGDVMSLNINEILSSIENAGYRAFIVGGYIRDQFFNRVANDIDITTDAPLNKLKIILSDYKFKVLQHDSIKLKIDSCTIDIAMIRKEKFIDGLIVCRTLDLKQDFERRDFKINAIYKDKNEVIYDYMNSIDDCINRKISFIGNSLEKVYEDPLRILRFIKLILDNDLTYDNHQFRINKNMFDSIDKNIIKKYLKEIFIDDRIDNAIRLFVEFDIYYLFFKNMVVNYKNFDDFCLKAECYYLTNK